MATERRAIERSAKRRGITRLCHVTPARNLAHILHAGAVLSTDALTRIPNAILNKSDPLRLDGYTDHVCCSIQYPNVWYMDRVSENEELFRDWVVLLIRPDYLWCAGTKFCQRNAAAGRGSHVGTEYRDFECMFASSVDGRRRFVRTQTRPASVPTDDQAEVLVSVPITTRHVVGVAVPNDAQARIERARLEQLRLESPPLFVAPMLFEARKLSRALRDGKLPSETKYVERNRR